MILSCLIKHEYLHWITGKDELPEYRVALNMYSGRNNVLFIRKLHNFFLLTHMLVDKSVELRKKCFVSI